MKFVYRIPTLIFVTILIYLPAFSRDRLNTLLPPASGKASLLTSPDCSLFRRADSIPHMNVPTIFIPAGKKKAKADRETYLTRIRKGYKPVHSSLLIEAKKPNLSKPISSAAKTGDKTSLSQTSSITPAEEVTYETQSRFSQVEKLQPENSKKTEKLSRLDGKKNVRKTGVHYTRPATGYTQKRAIVFNRPKRVGEERSFASANVKETPAPANALPPVETTGKQAEEIAQHSRNYAAKTAPASKSGKSAPLDSGVSVLLAAGVAAGIRRAYLRRKGVNR